MTSARESSPLLRLRRLTKTVGRSRPLLDIAQFDIPAGSCTLLSGQNGVGKTTLLKIIAGLVAPDAGDVEYDGMNLPWRVARRRYAGVAIYLHQHPYLFDRSVWANVAYGLRAAGLTRDEVNRCVDDALHVARLDHLATRNARELSGGEQQRVALTRALVLAPKLLLLDEPFASLDEKARERTGDLLHQLKKQGITLILTSHEKLSLTALADYHFELRDNGLTPIYGDRSVPRRAARSSVVAFDDAASRRKGADYVRGSHLDERH